MATGPESIRIAGVKIDELPIREQHEARSQLRLAEDEHRKAQIKEVLAKHSPYQLTALHAQIKMSEDGIQRAQKVIADENRTITEYRTAISMCELRDKELRALGVELNRK